MRLDKFLAHTADLTRQQAQRTVRTGGVCVNGTVVFQAAQQINDADVVTLDGEVLQAMQPRYLMLHKPVGYVCANSDSHHPVVLDLIHEPRRDSLQVVGRLDIDTTGLVLLTDDGQWNHRVTAPSGQCQKSYCVKLAQPLTDSAAEQLRRGVQLDGEKKPTRPAQLFFMDDEKMCVRLVIHEGKYHQVKRMFAATGNHVIRLHRESIGSIALDSVLAEGQYRALTHDEIASV